MTEQLQFFERKSDATLSADRVYRYALHRTFNATSRVAWLMLNPSTADASIDDPTIRKCIGFTQKWGLGGIDVVNCAAYRATDPRELYNALARGVDVVGPDNADHLEAILRGAELIVAAWGANPVRDFPAARDEYLRQFPNVVCLGRTKSGAPRHPLYVPYEAVVEKYPAAAKADEAAQ